MNLNIFLFQSPLSPGKLQEVEQKKLDEISSLSTSMLELKKRQSQLADEHNNLMKEKCSQLKNLRLAEYKGKAKEMDEKERDLCRRTNELVDDVVSKCDDTPFHKALIEILGNFKGNILYKNIYFLF